MIGLNGYLFVNLSKNYWKNKHQVLLSSGCAETCAGSEEEMCPWLLTWVTLQGQASGEKSKKEVKLI